MENRTLCVRLWLIAPAVIAFIAAAGCSTDRDSLKSEQAAMEKEAKAMAERPMSPGSSPMPTPPTGIGSSSQEAAVNGIRIPSGIEIKIAPVRALSSRTAETGAEWQAKLLEDIKVDGVVVAQAGAEAVGRFTLVSDGTRLRKKHELDLRIHKIKAASGNFVEVRTLSYIHEGEMQGRQPALIRADTPLTFRMASGIVFPR